MRLTKNVLNTRFILNINLSVLKMFLNIKK